MGGMGWGMRVWGMRVWGSEVSDVGRCLEQYFRELDRLETRLAGVDVAP